MKFVFVEDIILQSLTCLKQKSMRLLFHLHFDLNFYPFAGNK